jgi:putative FmdB family regulatory protein
LPTYEYRCESCDRNFDVVQSFHDDPLTACPTCGAPVRKVFGNVGIVFKGSGFYKTDSRNGGSGKSADGREPAPTSDSGSTGSEAAAEPKSSPSSNDSPSAPAAAPSSAGSEAPSKPSTEKSSSGGKASSG